jgi:hypothetical protein
MTEGRQHTGTHPDARTRLIERLAPFREDSASRWLGASFGPSSEWPEGSELNDVSRARRTGG